MDIKTKFIALRASVAVAFKKGASSLKDCVPFEKTMKLISEKKPIIILKLRNFVDKIKTFRLPGTLSFQKEKYERYGTETKKCLLRFGRAEPQIAAFVIVCLSCAFAILFLDKFFALLFLKSKIFAIFRLIALLNPSAWWFLILGGLWLFFTIYAGYSETPEVFATFTKKANALVFVLLTLGISSAATILINIVVGRYDTAALREGLYGFSLFSAGSTFPSWGAQSIWAVCLAFGQIAPKYRKDLIHVAEAVCLCLMLSGTYFISDVIIGAYIGILSYQVARWFVSDNRENPKLITFQDD